MDPGLWRTNPTFLSHALERRGFFLYLLDYNMERSLPVWGNLKAFHTWVEYES